MPHAVPAMAAGRKAHRVHSAPVMVVMRVRRAADMHECVWSVVLVVVKVIFMLKINLIEL